jgi:hypothetical protein
MSIEETFHIAIKTAAKTASRAVSSRQLAEAFYEAEPRFINHFQKEWAIDTVRTLIAAERGKIARAKNVRRQLGFGTVAVEPPTAPTPTWGHRPSGLGRSPQAHRVPEALCRAETGHHLPRSLQAGGGRKMDGQPPGGEVKRPFTIPESPGPLLEFPCLA